MVAVHYPLHHLNVQEMLGCTEATSVSTEEMPDCLLATLVSRREMQDCPWEMWESNLPKHSMLDAHV